MGMHRLNYYKINIYLFKIRVLELNLVQVTSYLLKLKIL